MQRPAKPFTPVRFRLQPPNIMKIGIVGYGFVGKALANGLNDNVEVIKIDPKLNTSSKDLKEFNPNIIFVCVPTPMMDDGSQDITILENALNDLKNYDLRCAVVVKSTVLPDNIKNIGKIFPDFIYNPEFLREKNADEDFINSKLIIFGGGDSNIELLSSFYKKHTKCLCKDYVLTDAVSASLIKYTINSFLAAKVIFFNEMFELFNKMQVGENWENFISFISKDDRIGDSHMMVPGHDGRMGFGGACFPKDTSAIMKYANSLGVDLRILESVIKKNNEIRSTYKKQTDREEEQNINFKNQ